MHRSLWILSLSLLTITHCEDISSSNLSPEITQISSTEYESNEIQDLPNRNADFIYPENTDTEVTGGGVWSSIGMIAVVICGCICLERLYASCKKVYQKRTGRYGFSRLHNQTFNEFEDEDDEEELDDDIDEENEAQNNVGTHTNV